MEEKWGLLTNSCSFVNVKPLMIEWPYPPIQVKEKNQVYANLLSVDYCGSVSELSAITITIPGKLRDMLIADIEAEKDAIRQYRMHIGMICDSGVNAVLARIIRDEEYHIILLQALMDELEEC